MAEAVRMDVREGEKLVPEKPDTSFGTIEVLAATEA